MGNVKNVMHIMTYARWPFVWFVWFAERGSADGLAQRMTSS